MADRTELPDITETKLPGVGVRYEFTTAEGERVGVVSQRSGGREIVVYDRQDPDACAFTLRLSSGEARTMTEVLGASQVSEVLADVQHRIQGLAIEWLRIPVDSRFIGATIGDGRFRTRTGASVVAVVRGDTTVPAPGPDFAFEAGDVMVAVGTPEGLGQLRELLRS